MMNFNRQKHREEPEINFIPLIDVLLVVLIFLMVSTSFTKLAELDVKLPSGKAKSSEVVQEPIAIYIKKTGEVSLDKQNLNLNQQAALLEALKQEHQKNPKRVLMIFADAQTEHQQIIQLMQLAQGVGIEQVSFAVENK